MFRRQDLWPVGVNSSIADAHFVHLVHQLGDQIKAKAGATETGDLPFRREDHARVFNRVLKVVFGHSAALRYATSRQKRNAPDRGIVLPIGAGGGIRKRTGVRGVVATKMPAQNGFDGKDGKRGPNEGERDQVRTGERLVIKESAEEKAAARREILEETDRRQAKMPRRVTEPDERQTGHDAGADQQEGKRPGHGTEDHSATALETQQVEKRNRHEQRRFEKKTRDGACSGFFSQ